MLSIFHLISNLMENLTLESISSYVRWCITYVDQSESFAARSLHKNHFLTMYDGYYIVDSTKEEDEAEDAAVRTRRCKAADSRYKEQDTSCSIRR